MPDSLIKYIVLAIPLLPLIASLWIALGFIFSWNRLEKGEKETRIVAIGSTSIILLLLVFLDLVYLFSDKTQINAVKVGGWLSSGKYQLDISFLLDYKSLSVATTVAFISLLVTKFSINYLHREAGFQRFFLLLSLFTSAMMLIILSGNALVAFMGWELAGVSSYLLISYSWHRNTATNNANRALITNRIGDAGFILAIVLSLFWFGSVEWLDIGNSENSKIHLGLILFGFMIAALVKSAQIPFSAWITRALEGPTPSSAVFYGAVMVHAGVFLLLRLEPLLIQVPSIQIFIIFIGVLTVLYSVLSGLVQTDIKSAFMFSTLGQVALMFIWIGFGWFDLALVHLILHSIWRTYQFLHAPSYMQHVDRPMKQVPQWLSKNTWLYNAALQRFWLDVFSDWLFTRPVQSISHEVQLFDEQVVDRITGISSHSNMVSTLSHWEAHKQGRSVFSSEVGKGRGFFGKTLELIASVFEWFEERLILKGSGESFIKVINFLGSYLELIDKLLMKPRYALLLILATFVLVL